MTARGDLAGIWRFGLWPARMLVALLFRVRVEHLERVPVEGPVILAPNHVSMIDGPLLAIVVASRRRRMTRFLVASEFFSNRWLRLILNASRQIPIRRGQRDVAALHEAIDTVRRGALAGIFPEGTVNPEPGEIGRVRRGAARIALPAGAPIVPVGIWGTQTRWSKRGGLSFRGPLRTRVVLSFGPQLPPEGDPTSVAAVEAHTRRLAAALAEQMAEARRLS